MLNTPSSRRGMVVAPHHLAAQAGLFVLREGGNAVEAMVAAAATIAVVYPHMNGIGGDGFWLIAEPGKPPVGIDACGAAASAATPDLYRDPWTCGHSKPGSPGGQHGGRHRFRLGCGTRCGAGLERPETAAVAPAGRRRPLRQ